MSTAAHALTRVNDLPTGVVVGCRCGWTQFVQPGDLDPDVHVGAKLALAAHKAAQSGRKAAARQLDRKITTEARRVAELATSIADGDHNTTDLLDAVEALVKFIKESNAS